MNGGPVGSRGVDPRLLRHARSTRTYLLLAVVLGVGYAGLAVAQAAALATVVATVFEAGPGPVAVGAGLAVLLAVVAARGVLAWGQEVVAHRASARAKSELREGLVLHATDLAAAGALPVSSAEVATLAVRGVDALDVYFARYLPQLVLAAVVPLAVVVAVFLASPLSALLVVLTVPLVPLFMALVGWRTAQATDRQYRALARLSGHFLDVVAGLPTLVAFGRAKGQATAIRTITEEHRTATMHVLRLAFLSSLVLELLATLSVALVAVTLGFSLLAGHVTLQVALFVLVVAPEAYLPWRLVGQHFHAGAEGARAASAIFAVLETPLPADLGGRSRPVDAEPSPRTGVGLRLDGVTVDYPDRGRPALDALTLVVPEGTTAVLVGASGAGKSTVLRLLAGLRAPQAGTVTTVGREQVAWLPQQPRLFATSIRENIRVARGGADDLLVERAAAAAGVLEFADRLPEGLDAVLAERGAGLSAGQRQRVALARVLLRDAPVVLLDEPTAGLDPATEAALVPVIAAAVHGRTAVIVTHREALLDVPGRRVVLDAGRLAGSVDAAPSVAGRAR